MAVAANKRSVMTLFSSASDMYSHQVRIVLAEKGVSVEVELVDEANLPAELIELNPYKTVPTLVDRELALYDSKIIMDKALPFIRSAVEQKKPFYAVIWFHTPHLPILASEKHRKLYLVFHLFSTSKYTKFFLESCL